MHATAPLNPAIETDALIVGAGPVGLYQVFQLGLLEISAHVVDALPQAGGQCVALYADKPIYDIPATPVCTGRELIANLLKQAQPFAPHFHWGQIVTTLAQQADGRFLVETSQATRFVAKAVFIAAGVGAFQPRKLPLAGLEAFEGTQVLYEAPEPAAWAGQDVVIAGGGEAALAHALAWAQMPTHRPRSVTLLHRRDAFEGTPAQLAQLQTLRSTGQLHVALGQPTGWEEQAGRLQALRVLGTDGQTSALPLNGLLVALGLSPRLGPIAHWGLAMERKQLPVSTQTFSTDVPGLFAVGDINTYPGKKKLIACGFHECVLAAFAAAGIVFPGQPIHLQYTTTSPRLHQLLGTDQPH